jgi:hypothetical protein
VDLAMTVTVTITITSKLHLVSTSVAMKPKSGYDSHDQMETRLKYECRETYPIYHGSVIIITNIFKKLINNSRGKYKRNECLINVCKSDTDLS